MHERRSPGLTMTPAPDEGSGHSPSKATAGLHHPGSGVVYESVSAVALMTVALVSQSLGRGAGLEAGALAGGVVGANNLGLGHHAVLLLREGVAIWGDRRTDVKWKTERLKTVESLQQMFMSGRVYQWEKNPQGSSNAAQRKLPEEVRGREVRIDLQGEAHRSKLHICKEQFAFLYLNIEYFETRMQEAPPTGLCCYCIWNCDTVFMILGQILLVVSSVRRVTSVSKWHHFSASLHIWKMV